MGDWGPINGVVAVCADGGPCSIDMAKLLEMFLRTGGG